MELEFDQNPQWINVVEGIQQVCNCNLELIQVFLHIVDLRNPEMSPKVACSFDKRKLLGRRDVVNVEGKYLHQGFEMLADQVVLILNHITSAHLIRG
jgi:hypothetical protein